MLYPSYCFVVELNHSQAVQTEKNNTERLASLGIMGDQLRAAWNPSYITAHYHIEGLREALNWSPIMPRDSSLSDSRCIYFQFGFVKTTFFFVTGPNTAAMSEGFQDGIWYDVNPFMPTVAFNICFPRDCVSRHNGGTSGAPLKPLRVDSALQALSTLYCYSARRYCFIVWGNDRYRCRTINKIRNF